MSVKEHIQMQNSTCEVHAGLGAACDTYIDLVMFRGEISDESMVCCKLNSDMLSHLIKKDLQYNY